MRMLPEPGCSIGSGWQVTSPLTNPHSQVWHTPVRHDHLTWTSQASARSSRLRKAGSQDTVRLLRLNEIAGPLPWVPSGGCGGCFGDAATPGGMAALGPKTSMLIRSGVTPPALHPAPRAWVDGPG